MSGTSRLQDLYKFKAIAIKASAGVCTEGLCYIAHCVCVACVALSHRKLHFFTSPDIIHCAAEAGSAASPDCSMYSLAVVSTPLALTLGKECTVPRPCVYVHIHTAKSSPCSGD